MDTAIKIAFRAIIAELKESGAFSDQNVKSIVARLEAAEPEAKRFGKEGHLLDLLEDIRKDAGV